MDHICPREIADLFDDDATIAVGRARAVAWAGTLDLKQGDRVWMPDQGWMVKERPRAN